MQIEAFENGDTEYTFSIKMHVGCSDKRGSTVSIGCLHFNIAPYCISSGEKLYKIETDGLGSIMNNGMGFKTKWDAVDWLIRQIQGV